MTTDQDKAAMNAAWEKRLGGTGWPAAIEFANGFAAALEYARQPAEPVGRCIGYVDGHSIIETRSKAIGIPAGANVYTTPQPAPLQPEPVEPSEDAKRTLNAPPERIYLQVGNAESDFPGEISWRDVTWCDEQCERNDLMYIRSDLAQPAPDVRELVEALQRFARIDLCAPIGAIVHENFGIDVLNARAALAKHGGAV